MKYMKPVYVSSQLIAACGLYCGACRKFRMGKCMGCTVPEAEVPGLRKPIAKGFQWCKIRKCCQGKGYHTCAECDKDVKDCKIHNNYVGKLFTFLFNSDRAACIRYIRHHGEDAFAERMAWDEKMTISKRV